MHLLPLQDCNQFLCDLLRLDLHHPRFEAGSLIVSRHKMDVLGALEFVVDRRQQRTVERNVASGLCSQQDPHRARLLVLQNPQRANALQGPWALLLLRATTTAWRLALAIRVVARRHELQHLGSNLVHDFLLFFSGPTFGQDNLFLRSLVVISMASRAAFLILGGSGLRRSSCRSGGET